MLRQISICMISQAPRLSSRCVSDSCIARRNNTLFRYSRMTLNDTRDAPWRTLHYIRYATGPAHLPVRTTKPQKNCPHNNNTEGGGTSHTTRAPPPPPAPRLSLPRSSLPYVAAGATGEPRIAAMRASLAAAAVAPEASPAAGGDGAGGGGSSDADAGSEAWPK